ncbi:MAG: hypothetical protein KDJ86_08260 [Bauldia sp.]|uniref:hypothetical protein n=1 Tax=Bauldia sp. TaxID=2575872 RepID=UPI001DED3083|nr:hypothetical protein [Bauldia sp.]MCB1495763.1 hypothetical protein [Bauldia sp.]
MALFAIAVPIVPEKMKQFEEFIEELNGARRDAFVASRKKLGVRERTFHQHTPMGDLVIVTLEGDSPGDAFARFGEGADPFTKWFREQVSEVHGIDLSAPPPGPAPRLLVDTAA